MRRVKWGLLSTFQGVLPATEKLPAAERARQ